MKQFYFIILIIGFAFLMIISCKKEADEAVHSPVFYYGSITDIDGNEYKTIELGNQTWMAENLKTTTYNDGTSITLIENNEDWQNNTNGAYCWYNYDQGTYANTYGALYNWYAVNTGNLCPDGWHVPTDEEWKVLEIHLGMSQEEADKIEMRGTNEGSKLAGDIDLWTDGDLISNREFGSSGFYAPPGGFRDDVSFLTIGLYGNWWSSVESDSYSAWYRCIVYASSEVWRNSAAKRAGHSVRCLKD